MSKLSLIMLNIQHLLFKMSRSHTAAALSLTLLLWTHNLKRTEKYVLSFMSTRDRQERF